MLRFLIAVLLFAGCAPSERGVLPQAGPTAAPDSVHPLALRHVIDASVFELRGDYAQAVLEYQDALRYSKDPAIFFGLSKSYSALGKHSLAIEAGRQSVRLSPENLDYRRMLADVYIAAFQVDSAARQYEEILARDSSDVNSWFALGRMYESRKPLRALEVYEGLLQRFGPEWTVLLQVAELYNKQGQFEKAAGALRQMKDLDPSNQPLQRTLAQTYARAKHYDDALSILNNLRELDPANLDYVADIGGIFLLQGKYDRAVDVFEPVLSLDTVSADSKVWIGQLMFDQTEKDSALRPGTERVFERIREAHPDDWRPYWFLGALATMRRDDSTAMVRFRRLTELAPWNPDGWVYLASAYFGQNDFGSMAKVLENGKKHVPDDFRVNFFLGVAYHRSGQSLEAVRALEKAHDINPKDIEAIAELAMVLDGLKRHEESDSLYEDGLRLNAGYHLILNNYGYSLAERNIQLERALDMATKAVDAQPKNASYLDTKAWVLYRLGKYKEAEEYLLSAIENGEPSATVLDHLGDVYDALGQKAKATEYWKKALELEPDNAAIKAKVSRGSR